MVKKGVDKMTKLRIYKANGGYIWISDVQEREKGK